MVENGPANGKQIQGQDDQIKKLLEKVDLKGIENWTKEEQDKVRQVLVQYNDIFVRSNGVRQDQFSQAYYQSN